MATEQITDILDEKGQKQVMLWEPSMGSVDVHFLNLPGLFHGAWDKVPSKVYHKMQLLSNTVLGAGGRSAAHARQALFAKSSGEEEKPTPAMKFGTAWHAAMGEPEYFEKHFVRLPELNRRKKDDNSEYYWYESQYGAEFCLKPDEYDAILTMKQTMHQHREAGPIIQALEYTETSFFWKDAQTGLGLKGRADGMSLSAGIIVDFKSCADCRPSTFEREILDREYYRQGAMYLRAARALGLPCDKFVFLAQEKSPPYAIGVYCLSATKVAKGEAEIDSILERLRKAGESNVWDDYTSAGIIEL